MMLLPFSAQANVRDLLGRLGGGNASERPIGQAPAVAARELWCERSAELAPFAFEERGIVKATFAQLQIDDAVEDLLAVGLRRAPTVATGHEDHHKEQASHRVNLTRM